MASETGEQRPDWEALQDLAVAQSGYFTTGQAAELGFSPELLIHHVQRGRLVRARRSVYRVRHLPPDEHEDLAVIWLWSGQEGVFSHVTALVLHGLSDAMPSQIDLSVPESWRRRRVRVPPGVRLHPRELAPSDVTWMGTVPLTTAPRTLRDCVAVHVQPELVRQAVDEGLRRGLFGEADVVEARRWLETFERTSK
jgi:predicted transcriptional regulator of viral defense system